MGEAYGTHRRGEESLYKALVIKPEGRGHSEDREVDGITIDLKEIGWWCGVDTAGSG
jgi:hypothetical protein